MKNENASVWSSVPFWRRSAAWVTGVSAILLVLLTFDSVGQISMGTSQDLENKVTKRVPSPSVINYKIGYAMSETRGHEVPTIGDKELFFGKEWSEDEAKDLLHLGKLTSQAKNCMNCHTILGNGAYYAPDLTKAWIDPTWETLASAFGGKEYAISAFLQDPAGMAMHKRRMPNLNITKDEAQGLVAFLKHMSSIDTNGFPRNFSKTIEQFKQGETNAH